MEDIRRSLDFHQTFKPERNCLNSLFTDLPGCSGKTVQEISVITGVPTGNSSGKVAPSIIYLEYMGLINQSSANRVFELSYTSLGDCVLMEDPGMMEELTLLLMHCMITRTMHGAELWSYLFHSILPKYHGSISKTNLDLELQLHFGKNVNLAPFNGTYTGIFELINVLEITSEKYSVRSHSYNPEFIYLYAFVLYEYWDEWVASLSDEGIEDNKVSKIEMTAPQLEEIGFRFPFGWDEQEEYQVLEFLQDKGIITLNRQMVPFSIRKVISKEEIVESLYSELC